MGLLAEFSNLAGFICGKGLVFGHIVHNNYFLTEWFSIVILRALCICQGDF